jgi:peptidoglycan/xylan/chitin deacetylase (PgdA/CDA1 family)
MTLSLGPRLYKNLLLLALLALATVGMVTTTTTTATATSTTVSDPRIIDASTKTHAMPTACNCVIFRMDDIQDSWLVPVQSAVIDKFVERNENLDIGVIMNSVGKDPALVSKVRQGIATGLIETSLHGWNHVPYDTLAFKEQRDTLQMANEKMQDLFGRKSTIFIPPYNAYNEDTLNAASQVGLKIISSEFDEELPSIYNPSNPDSPSNKIYKAIGGPEIKDKYGVYHIPQVIGFHTYSDRVVKTPLPSVKNHISNAIANYGYAVVTLHPQDFAVRDAKGSPLPAISKAEMEDLDSLITWINNKEYRISTFSSLTGVPLPPIVDHSPPDIQAPADKAVVSSSSRSHVDLGFPSVSDNVDLSPEVTNDAPKDGFPQGLTIVKWTATDAAGNTASANQYVAVAKTADKIRPTISITAPANGAVVSVPADGAKNITVQGTAFDSPLGVKSVEVRTTDTSYVLAKQKVSGDWSSWSYDLHIKKAGTLEIIARATDFFGNQEWSKISVTVSLGQSNAAAAEEPHLMTLSEFVVGINKASAATNANTKLQMP